MKTENIRVFINSYSIDILKHYKILKRYLGHVGVCRDSLQSVQCVDCLMALLNSEAKLRLSTSTKSQIEVAVHDRHSAANTQDDL